MADADNSVDTLKEQVTTLQQQLEAAKMDIKASAEKRDRIKMAKLEEIDKEAWEEIGDLKKQVESLNSEKEKYALTSKQLAEENEKHKKLADEFQTKYTEFETQTRTELLEQLPDGEVRELGQNLSLMDLRKYVQLQKKTLVKTDNITNVNSNNKTGYQYDPNSAWKTELNKIQRK
jgi:chromosome segregation ATPase